MRLKIEQQEQENEVEILDLLKAMSRVAKSAKKIEEITEVMDNISFQTTVLTLDAAILSAQSGRSWDGLSSVKTSVKDSAEEMYFQFNLLLEEVSELNRFVNDKSSLIRRKGMN